MSPAKKSEKAEPILAFVVSVAKVLTAEQLLELATGVPFTKRIPWPFVTVKAKWCQAFVVKVPAGASNSTRLARASLQNAVNVPVVRPPIKPSNVVLEDTTEKIRCSRELVVPFTHAERVADVVVVGSNILPFARSIS